ncbi:MAG: glycosyltransferase [Akkermansia sp.]|nr:glycosyltransferase [Akkermansia sp.]
MSAADRNADFDLSLIIICRDSMAVLPNCVGAVQPLMMQGELRVECLVVDMDSADGSQDYLAAERDRWHISGFVSETLTNRFEAMNRGLQLAQGRVCLFITPETELMVENTAACCAPILRGEVECVFSTAVQVNPDNGRHRPQTPNPEHLFLRPPCNHAAFFCATSLLRRLGGFDRQRYPALADVDMMHRVLAADAAYRVASLSTCRQYLRPEREEYEELHVDFLRFIASHSEEILMQCKAHPSYAVRTVHEILRHAVRCDWPVANDTLRALDTLLCGLSRVIRPIIRRKIVRRLRRRAVIQALLIPFKGLRRARITRKLCRSHFHVARLLEKPV